MKILENGVSGKSGLVGSRSHPAEARALRVDGLCGTVPVKGKALHLRRHLFTVAKSAVPLLGGPGPGAAGGGTHF